MNLVLKERNNYRMIKLGLCVICVIDHMNKFLGTDTKE